MPDDDAATLDQAPAAPARGEPRAIPPAEEWLGDLSALPPRPRRRLLTPAPLALVAALLLAIGFLGGVLVEKGQTGSSSSTGTAALASRLRALGGSASGTGGFSGAPGASGSSGAAGSARPTVGTVSFLSGQTLYLTTTGSGTVKVETSAATSVTKTAKSAVKSIHPGETVTVTGSTGADGTLEAASIRVGSTGGLGGLFAGGGSKGTTGSSAGSGSGEPALFGSG